MRVAPVVPLRGLARAARSFGPTWRYVFNFSPTVSYRIHPCPPSGEALRVLGDLNRRGIAITSAGALLGPDSCFDELATAVEGLERERVAEVAAARARASESAVIGEKAFMFQALGMRPQLDPASVFARFALQRPILDVANAYFGMFTRLRYYNVWHTFATQGAARESQLWHRDREDRLVLKVFVYLSDVDGGSGPFTYAARSHPKSGAQLEPEYAIEGGVRRSTDAQMEAVVPQDRWVEALGRRGTIVFADTRGYHKGGCARTGDRVLYTCMFTSPASQSQELLVRTGRAASAADRARAFALS